MHVQTGEQFSSAMSTPTANAGGSGSGSGAGDDRGQQGLARKPTQGAADADSLKTTRNYIIGGFILLAVAGQVLVARRNTQTLREIAKRKGVKFEAPPKSKHDDDWF